MKSAVQDKIAVQNKVLPIAEELKRFFLVGPLNPRDFSIFLCGGSTPSQEKFRRTIGDTISRRRSQYRYTVYYPEDMFKELMLGHGKEDLLTLENMLAESSHCVAILVTSPGTYTELGAFANHPKLKNKLIIIADIKFKKSKSFINLGPIRHLQKKTESKVVWLSMDHGNIKNICAEITELCRGIAKKNPPNARLSNLIFSREFYLALIYSLGPIGTGDVMSIANAISSEPEDLINISAEASINFLIKEGNVSCISGKLSPTDEGAHRLIYSNRTRKSRIEVSGFMSAIRCTVLNELYRGKIGTRGKAFDI